MAKTFLQLCNMVKRESRVAGPAIASVAGNTGLIDDIVNWVRDAWSEIQRERINWRWMRAPFSLPVAINTTVYAYGQATDTRDAAPISRFGSWWARDMRSPYKIYRNASGVADEGWLIYVPIRQFERLYLFGANRSSVGKPIHITVDDAENLVLWPVPTELCTVTGDYQRGPQTLSADSDVPDFPERFHDLIAYRAMERYGGTQIAAETITRAVNEGGRLMAALELSQLEGYTMGAPLA